MGKKYDLVCFDLDGTLIEEDNGDILWKRMSDIIHDDKSINVQRAKDYHSGKITIEEWVDLDLGDWKKYGVTKDFVIEQAKHSKLIKGVKETLKKLKKNGIKLAVISGSLDILLDTVFKDHPFQDVFINKMYFNKKGVITHWKTSKYCDKFKGAALKNIAKKEKIPLSRTVYIGDHKNDVSAAKIAGLSISFNSKSKELDEVCDVIITKKDMK